MIYKLIHFDVGITHPAPYGFSGVANLLGRSPGTALYLRKGGQTSFLSIQPIYYVEVPYHGNSQLASNC